MTRLHRIGIPAAFVVLILTSTSAIAQRDSPDGRRLSQLDSQVGRLNSQVSQIRRDVEDLGSDINGIGGYTVVFLFLFGAFCALWAQNSRRNPWLWFFMGLFFHVITVLVLLWKNSADRRPPEPLKPLP